MLHYFEAGDDAGSSSVARYTAEIHIPGNQFNELVFAARPGRLPSEIVVDVEGLKHDSPHYVRRKTLDNKSISSTQKNGKNRVRSQYPTLLADIVIFA